MRSYQNIDEYEQYMTEGEKFSIEEINAQIQELTELLEDSDNNLYQWYREEYEQLSNKDH